jgi:hypothetical protein
VGLGVFGARDADETEQVAEGSDSGMHAISFFLRYFLMSLCTLAYAGEAWSGVL